MNLEISDHIKLEKFNNENKKYIHVGNNFKLKKIGWKAKITFKSMILDIINSQKK